MARTFLLLLLAAPLLADQIPVRLLEGRIHGFLTLRDTNDNILATGELVQTVTGNQVTANLAFHFKDGSVQDETTTFSQRRAFQLLNYHLVQKGKTFKRPTDMTINASTGQVTVRYTEEDGKEKTITERMTLPADLSNGMVSTLMSDIDPKTPKTVISMLVSTPKPRVVKLEITPQGEESFTFGGTPRKASRYAIHVDIGGITGVVAGIVGKQPPDTSIWMVGGKAPGFLKSEGQTFDGGPTWQIELASPVWSKTEITQKR